MKNRQKMSQYLSSWKVHEFRRRKNTTNDEETGKLKSKAKGFDDLDNEELGELVRFIEKIGEEGEKKEAAGWSEDQLQEWAFGKLKKKYPDFEEDDFEEFMESLEEIMEALEEEEDDE